MAITVQEKIDSRSGATGTSPSISLVYIIDGTDDEVEARNAVAGEAPTYYAPFGDAYQLQRQTINLDPISETLWEATVQYGPLALTGTSTFSFETSGGTAHFAVSKQTVAQYYDADYLSGAPNTHNGINAGPDGVEGCDAVVPVYQFSETHYISDAMVTNEYKGILFALTGCTNNAPFKGCAAGEALFLGASGTKRSAGDWEITFRFAASPNTTGQTIGGITNISKGGWEYLWVRFIDDVDETAKTLIKIPILVNIERLYDSGDFSQLGIGV